MQKRPNISSPLSFYICLLFITIIFATRLVSVLHTSDFSFDYQQLQNQYNNSQIVRQSQATMTMLDPQLYTYAGYTYVTQGRLDQINIEHPPTGKYFYGISAILFHSPLYVQLLFGFILTIMVYLLSYRIFHNSLLAIIPSLLLLMDKLFINQIRQSELDLPLTSLLSVFLFVYTTKWDKSVLKYIILGLLLGLIAGIKFPVTALLLAFLFSLYEVLSHPQNQIKARIMLIIICLLISIFVYLLAYSQLILNSGIISFLDVHIAAIKIHRSHLPNYPPLMPLKVLLFNSWFVWFDAITPIQKVGEWTILWPTGTFALIASPIIFWKSRNRTVLFILLFSLLYFLFINTRLFFPRYLMELLPFTYILLVWIISVLVRNLKLDRFLPVSDKF